MMMVTSDIFKHNFTKFFICDRLINLVVLEKIWDTTVDILMLGAVFGSFALRHVVICVDCN